MSQPNEKPIPPPNQQTSEGLRSIKTTNVFRALNFELYMKNNKTTMILGAVSISLCAGYLLYMNWNIDRSKYYTATLENGQYALHPKTSRWES